MIHRLLGAQLGDVMEALGDPPNLTNLIGTFWTEQRDKMRAALVPELHRLALHGTEALAPTKAEPLPILWDEAVISEEAMRWARQYGYDLIRDLNERTQRLVQEQVQHFAETPGGTLGQLRASLDSAFGIRRAQTIAVTETTRAFSQGMDLVHHQISSAGIQMDKVWQTSNDERVCPICGPNHDKKEREWMGVSGPPPAHPNCRCWVTLRLPEMVQIAEAPVARTFVPAASVDDVVRRMADMGIDYKITDLPLDAQNTILRSTEDILGRYRSSVQSMGYNESARRRRNLGTAVGEVGSGETQIKFQKKFMRNPEKDAREAAATFAGNREANIAQYTRYVNDPARAAIRDYNQDKLDHWKAATRWGIHTDPDIALEAVVRHELYHSVDNASGHALREALSKAISDRGYWHLRSGVSEYSFTNPAELFAELATARDLGVSAPLELLNILDEVMRNAAK